MLELGWRRRSSNATSRPQRREGSNNGFIVHTRRRWQTGTRQQETFTAFGSEAPPRGHSKHLSVACGLKVEEIEEENPLPYF